MTEENQALVATEEVITPPAEAAFSSQDDTQQQERDFEAEARDQGWVPLEEFNDAPGKWKPAEQFVKDGEEILPLVRAQNKKLQARLDTIEKELKSDFEKRLDRIEKAGKRSHEELKKRHEKELQTVKVKMREAVKAGDTDAYDTLEKQRDELAASTPDEDGTSPEHAKAAQAEWAAKNPWFNKDFEATRTAIDYSQWLSGTNENLSIEENIARTEAYMREKHPGLFGEEVQTQEVRPNGHAPVDGGSEFGRAATQKGKLFPTLPAEARRQFEADVAEGLFKKSDSERWAKTYLS